MILSKKRNKILLRLLSNWNSGWVPFRWFPIFKKKKMFIYLLKSAFIMPQYSMNVEQKPAPIYYLLLLFTVLVGSVIELWIDLQSLA